MLVSILLYIFSLYHREESVMNSRGIHLEVSQAGQVLCSRSLSRPCCVDTLSISLLSSHEACAETGSVGVAK